MLVGTLPFACHRVEDSVDDRYAAGVLGILIGALILLRAFRASAILRPRWFLHGRYLKAASAMAGGLAIICYDGKLSPCFTLALCLSILFLATSFIVRLWGLVQIARSENAGKKEPHDRE